MFSIWQYAHFACGKGKNATCAKIGLAFIIVVAIAAVARGRPEVSIKCAAKGASASGNCVIENKGSVAGNFAADVVLVCRDGEHTAHLAARVEANNHFTKIIEGFTPSVGLFTSCAGIDYQNMTVK